MTNVIDERLLILKHRYEYWFCLLYTSHRRVHIIRNIQFIIVTSLLLSAVSMLAIYLHYQTFAQALFFVALLMQIVALMLSIWEITMSIHALKIELSDMEAQLGKRFDLFGRSRAKE